MMKRTVLVVLLFVALGIAAIAQNAANPHLQSLVDAERLFAKTSVEKGIRDSFLLFFADDGINFQPDPINAKAALRSQSSETSAGIILNWEPVFAEVSMARDLGYTTGPYWLSKNGSEKKVLKQGYYFSIWKTQSDGSWKVVLDLGTTIPDSFDLAAVKFAGAKASKHKPMQSGLEPQEQRKSLLDADRGFITASTSSALEAFLKHSRPDIRMHRNGSLPFIGRNAIRSYLNSRSVSIVGEPINAAAAKSNDLGYTYGRYELRELGSTIPKRESGYYVRVWTRNQNGVWRIAFDTMRPTSNEPGS